MPALSADDGRVCPARALYVLAGIDERTAMGIGTGRVVRQLGGRAMFSIVKVEATPATSGLTVTFEPAATISQGASQYIPAVTVGIRYAWEKLNPYERGGGVAVKVHEITPLLVDTTEITKVYAAALALWDAVRLQPEQPITLNPQTRSADFPI